MNDRHRLAGDVPRSLRWQRWCVVAVMVWAGLGLVLAVLGLALAWFWPAASFCENDETLTVGLAWTGGAVYGIGVGGLALLVWLAVAWWRYPGNGAYFADLAARLVVSAAVAYAALAVSVAACVEKIG